MFAESIDATLQEFIYAVNQCHEDDGTFVRDERYESIAAQLLELSTERLNHYAGQLEMIASRTNDKKWQKFLYRFKHDFELIPS